METAFVLLPDNMQLGAMKPGQPFLWLDGLPYIRQAWSGTGDVPIMRCADGYVAAVASADVVQLIHALMIVSK